MTEMEEKEQIKAEALNLIVEWICTIIIVGLSSFGIFKLMEIFLY